MTRSISRHFALPALLSAALLALTPNGVGAAPVSFDVDRTAESADRVEVSMEAVGTLKQISANNELIPSDVKLLGAFEYDERTLIPPTPGATAARSVRDYKQAAARIVINETEMKPALRADVGRIVVDVVDGRPVLFSPAGPLTSEEIDLIDIQANSLLLDHLLPTEPKAEDESFTPPTTVWAPLLGIDAISQCDAQSIVTSVDEKTALIETSGQVEGAVDGAETAIEFKCRLQYHRQLQRVTWFAIVIKETRSVSHVGPAIEATARIEVKITPTRVPDRLSDASLQSLTLAAAPETTSLEYSSPRENWTLLHDRDWVVTQEDEHRSILRLLDHGEFIAQCNITTMPPVEPNKMPTLDDFRDDVQKALGDSFGQFVVVAQKATDSNYRLYNVVVDGAAEDRPLRWHYYLLTNDRGFQTMMAFVVDADLIEQFEDGGLSLVESLRFPNAPRPLPTTPSLGRAPDPPGLR